METWKDVPGWETRYEVSDAGQVRSKDMQCGAINGAVAVRKGRVLTQILKGDRYFCVTLTSEDGSRKQVLVHDIVAAAFIGVKPPKMQVAHNDGSKVNNTSSNLRYATPGDNARDKYAHGTMPMGARHHMAKLTESDVVAIRASDSSNKVLAQQYGVGACQIWAVRTRRSWSHI